MEQHYMLKGRSNDCVDGVEKLAGLAGLAATETVGSVWLGAGDDED